ncbi:MAG: hypothetical protein ABSB22_10125 [Thermodesulfobacteriota bacterium]|jgi:hypothetical protein
MKKRIPFVPVLLVLALAGLMLSGIACEWLLPYSSYTSPTTYKCTAQIYRTLPGSTDEFVENWQAWVWPVDMNGDKKVDGADAFLACQEKVNTYISDVMAPGLATPWQYRNLAASPDPKPLATLTAEWCPDEPTDLYGAPLGSDMAVWYPNASAYVEYKDEDGNLQNTTATAMNANLVFAERTGLPVFTSGGVVYDRANHHLRISDFRIEFNPFTAGSLNVKKLSIQSIGTIIASDVGGNAYRIYPADGRFYVEMTLEKEGTTKQSNQCFAIATFADVKVVTYGTPQVLFSFQTNSLQGFPNLQFLRVIFSPVGDPFQQHQPYVYLKDKQWNKTSGYLTIGASGSGDFIGDQDNDLDLSKILWFENFELWNNETYLGNMGNSLLLPVNLSWGQHQITVVVYDKRGSYATSTMNLTVQRLPGDVDGNGQVCSKDIQLIMAALGQKATGPDDPRDIDRDGSITIADARKAALLCTYPNCVCK